MTVIDQFESVLRKMLVLRGKDPNNLEDEDTSNYLLCIKYLEKMLNQVGEKETLDFYRNELNQMITALPESTLKDEYILVLSQFNKEINNSLN